MAAIFFLINLWSQEFFFTINSCKPVCLPLLPSSSNVTHGPLVDLQSWYDYGSWERLSSSPLWKKFPKGNQVFHQLAGSVLAQYPMMTLPFMSCGLVMWLSVWRGFICVGSKLKSQVHNSIICCMQSPNAGSPSAVEDVVVVFHPKFLWTLTIVMIFVVESRLNPGNTSWSSRGKSWSLSVHTWKIKESKNPSTHNPENFDFLSYHPGPWSTKKSKWPPKKNRSKLFAKQCNMVSTLSRFSYFLYKNKYTGFLPSYLWAFCAYMRPV